MVYSKDEVKSDDDLGKILDESLRGRGWGRCLSVTKRADKGETVYVFTCRGAPFSYERKAQEPACHLTRGKIVGALEAYLGRKAMTHSETQCQSMGAPSCVFEITFPTETK